MRATLCALLIILIQCVFSVPVSPGPMDEEDVKVMRCIVEVLADALTKPHAIPLSQRCLETLRADDRLVTILRRHNFLQELQAIAEEGAGDRSERQAHIRDQPKEETTAADQSMLIGMLRPGEAVQERGAEDESNTEKDEREHGMISSQEQKNERRENQEQEQAVVKKAEDKEEEEKHSSLEKEEAVEAEQNALEGERKRKADVEKMRKENDEMRTKPWSRARQAGPRRFESTYDQQEASHHSKEIWKSPEQEELQMMVRRDPEEGSASKKTEEAEMENLAMIESELESVAQKLHELRHG